MRLLLAAIGAVALLALLPTVAWAWTPGTHILLGEAVLRSAALLPPAIAALLRPAISPFGAAMKWPST